MDVVTISSWLNFGRPGPPGRSLRWGEIFWLRLTTASAQCLRFSERFLLLNSSDGNDGKLDMFSVVDCRWLWKSWLWRVVLALKKKTFLFSRCSKWCPAAFLRARNHFLYWSTASSMMFCDMLSRVSMRRLLRVAGVLRTRSCINPQIR